MAVIVLVPHRTRTEAQELTAQAIDWLHEQGHEVRIPELDGVNVADRSLLFGDEVVAKDADLAVSVGGDGTMLRTVDLVAQFGVPVLGINAGHLGYLTAVPAHQTIDALKRFLVGDYAVESRMTLQVDVESHSGECDVVAQTTFNEVVVEKTISGHTINIAVELGGRPFLTYAADGMIIATPSGSTAYNMSARGPIVSPHLDAIVFTPVSPHMLFDRSLVLQANETVRMIVLDGREASLVIDGVRRGVVHPGDSVVCNEGKMPARLVVFNTRDMHGILKSKFGLSDR